MTAEPRPGSGTPADERPTHEFVGVAGHPDDDECTFRSDGTDATYCGLPELAHQWDESWLDREEPTS